ncbi:MAG: hypothetical protein MUC63_01345 [Planctomycetes bacterium]|nr:hypothetical protein [Planctomycetota bacterium]
MKKPEPAKKYESKDAEKTYASWLVRNVLEVAVAAALVLGGLRALGAMGMEWAKPYDVLGRYVLKSYPEAAPAPEKPVPPAGAKPG